jgi:hypothetical protein
MCGKIECSKTTRHSLRAVLDCRDRRAYNWIFATDAGRVLIAVTYGYYGKLNMEVTIDRLPC